MWCCASSPYLPSPTPSDARSDAHCLLHCAHPRHALQHARFALPSSIHESAPSFIISVCAHVCHRAIARRARWLVESHTCTQHAAPLYIQPHTPRHLQHGRTEYITSRRGAASPGPGGLTPASAGARAHRAPPSPSRPSPQHDVARPLRAVPQPLMATGMAALGVVLGEGRGEQPPVG